MPSEEIKQLDLKRAFARLAAQAAPAAPDLETAFARASLPRPAALGGARTLRFVLLPLAATLALGISAALLLSRAAPSPSLSARGADLLLASANDQAAALVGLSPLGEAESLPAIDSSGIESDLMGYLGELWANPID